MTDFSFKTVSRRQLPLPLLSAKNTSESKITRTDTGTVKTTVRPWDYWGNNSVLWHACLWAFCQSAMGQKHRGHCKQAGTEKRSLSPPVHRGWWGSWKLAWSAWARNPQCDMCLLECLLLFSLIQFPMILSQPWNHVNYESPNRALLWWDLFLKWTTDLQNKILAGDKHQNCAVLKHRRPL